MGVLLSVRCQFRNRAGRRCIRILTGGALYWLFPLFSSKGFSPNAWDLEQRQKCLFRKCSVRRSGFHAALRTPAAGADAAGGGPQTTHFLAALEAVTQGRGAGPAALP